MRIAAAVAIAVAVSMSAAACGGDDADDDRAAITATLERLFEAQEQGDAETACRDLYVIQEPERPGGEEGESEEAESEEAEAEEGESEEGEEGEPGECEEVFEEAQALREHEVQDLSTEVTSVEVDDDRATAIVRTDIRRADGTELSQDVSYDLVRTEDGWRVRIAEEG